MVITVARECDAPPTAAEAGSDSIPVDVEFIRDGLIHALELPLATTTREVIDSTIHQVRGHLNLLMGEELGYDSDDAVRELFRRAYALLDLGRRPNEASPAFEAFAHLRDTARVAQRLLDNFERLRHNSAHRPEPSGPWPPEERPGSDFTSLSAQPQESRRTTTKEKT
ncbi:MULTISPECIES: DUF6415 family natural product biosynthesis protein [unclassified Streptomyces]|uniref:DUF6415 family natural product biosynthesis protein n=1 Tax=unclassified Streptomyces TaxID=2593676 RepID=UPI002E2DB61F|nr:DUF6415 family natural product biosynthesis protein [Streptomyces sp. NBC_00441]